MIYFPVFNKSSVKKMIGTGLELLYIASILPTFLELSDKIAFPSNVNVTPWWLRTDFESIKIVPLIIS